jgi:anaerobic magnesium-protoporphyrin IX monomethyl ester cyclase
MGYSKAVVINPPNPTGFSSNKDSMGGFGQLYSDKSPAFPPLDLPYLLAYLIGRGHPVEVIEAGAHRWTTAQVVKKISGLDRNECPLLLVRTSLPTIDWDLNVCREIRAALPTGAIALIGPAVPSLLRRVKDDPTIDFAILGEPDGPAADLMDGRELASISGLMYRVDGEWRTNAERPFERALDTLPFPRWDLMPVEKYVIPKSSTAGHARFLPMLSSRGCPFGCSYCPYPVGQGLKWRYRSPQNVVDEMEHLVRNFGVEYILFRDPMFSAKEKRVVEICEEIVRRGLKVKWKCETRVDCLEDETIAAMARAGCAGLNFGVESIDPEIQKGVHRKPIFERDFIRVVNSCRRHGIATFAFFVVGLPGDTLATILNSISFAVRIRANWTQFTVATPFVGTPMYDWAVNQGFLAPEAYRIINAHDTSVGNENLSPTNIKRLHRFAQLLQNHVINRHGILKNELRRDLPYRASKALADACSRLASTVLLTIGQWYFRRTIQQLPQKPRTALDSSSPIATGSN